MQREEVKAKHAAGVQLETQIIPNPADTSAWIVLFKKDAGTSFFLVDAQEQVESFANLNALIEELRQLGIKAVDLHL
ncbi:MAG: hypothetical protein V4812_15515 [Pseudomonadota bacterium]